MRGDYASAIEDFRFYIESMPEYAVFKSLRSKRQAWVAKVEAGRNLFDSAMSEVIRLRGEVFQ